MTDKKKEDPIFPVPLAYGGRAKDPDIQKRSSSGGIFTLLAEYVLARGGTVYGCRMNEDLKPVHTGIQKREELDLLRGSKYVQSHMGDCYVRIREQLKRDEYVLFVGTPCQTAGLKHFLKEEYPKLYLCDFICHGVPSPAVFQDYLAYLEETEGEKVLEFRFRNKDLDWNSVGQTGTKVIFRSGKERRFMPAYKDAFMNGFLSDLYLRPSCYQCAFKSIPKRYADITIGDFWGAKKVLGGKGGPGGTSLVLLNSRKGKELFDQISEGFDGQECSFDKAIRKNQSIISSWRRPPQRERFFSLWREKGFDAVRRKYLTFGYRVMAYISRELHKR